MTSIDITSATIVLLNQDNDRLKRYAKLLIDHVERRSGIRWSQSGPKAGQATITLSIYDPEQGIGRKTSRGLRPPAYGNPEGFEINISRSDESEALQIHIMGGDDRGTLFGIGKFLRSIYCGPMTITVDGNLFISESPQYPIRGHQLGYRPKNNTYDAWTPAIYEQYIIDLALFGANAVELMPPKTDDAETNELMQFPAIEMLRQVSGILDDYGLYHYLWYPAMAKDYSDPSTQLQELAEWEEVFQACRRLDAVFVPGGDPGHTPPDVLFPFLAQVSEILHKHHPAAELWLSPQGFSSQDLERFYRLVGAQPKWLTGIVHGPGTAVPITELRKHLPAHFPLRLYPDIAHCLECQFPVPDWDVAYAMTWGREPINPRPYEFAELARTMLSDTLGFVSYSEGSNDDVNKFIWTQVAWNSSVQVNTILREYARTLILDESEEAIAQIIIETEKHWQGPLLSNSSVGPTLRMVKRLESQHGSRLTDNWRFSFLRYRAYYDAYVRLRLLMETAADESARSLLIPSSQDTVQTNLNLALHSLEIMPTPAMQSYKAVIERIAQELFTQIGIQLSVKRYGASGGERGATLDTLDAPISNLSYLHASLKYLQQNIQGQELARQVQDLIEWFDGPPGSVFASLPESIGYRCYVVMPNDQSDPTALNIPHGTFVTDFFTLKGTPPRGSLDPRTKENDAISLPLPSVFRTAVEIHDDSPLQIIIPGLSSTRNYRLGVAYYGRSLSSMILRSHGTIIHGPLEADNPPRIAQFLIPHTFIDQTGHLDLTFEYVVGSTQVSALWLVPEGSLAT